MARLASAPVVTTSQTTELKLAPKLRKKILTELKDFALLKRQIDDLTEELEASKGTIEELRAEAGAKELTIEGFKVTLVEGTTTYFDKQMCIDEGWLSPTQVEEATKVKPKKAYTLVTPPKEKK